MERSQSFFNGAPVCIFGINLYYAALTSDSYGPSKTIYWFIARMCAPEGKHAPNTQLLWYCL